MLHFWARCSGSGRSCRSLPYANNSAGLKPAACANNVSSGKLRDSSLRIANTIESYSVDGEGCVVAADSGFA